jgi:hypothetical protein
MIVIDTQGGRQRPSNIQQFTALQDALESTGEWHELTITSFPPEESASQLDFQAAKPMNVLKILYVDAGCVNSPSFTHLLGLVPTGAPLSELGLSALFASAHFLQPHWFTVLQNLTVLIVNGRGIHEPFQLLPAFTQLQRFEADHLSLPIYEPNANLPLLQTLQKLHIRACSVQWMAGREFPCLVECVILLPQYWKPLQQYTVILPSCTKFTFHGYPITTIQYFHVPQMNVMELGSHDCNQQRVYQQLYHLWTLNSSISKLTTLHLTLQCSGRSLIKALKCMGALQKLILCIAYPSPSWEHFLRSLAAKPSTMDMPKLTLLWTQEKWKEWTSSQTWHTNVLPSLKYLGIQSPKGFSQSQCLDNLPLLRLVAWTQAQLVPPLQHLNVWEGRGTTDDNVVDYISTGYMEKHLGPLEEGYDWMIVSRMVTQMLCIYGSDTPLFKLYSTVLFRQLQALVCWGFHGDNHVLAYLEQIIKLVICSSSIPAYPLDTNLPLVHTLQKLELSNSSFSWMLGRSFKQLKECIIMDPDDTSGDLSKCKGLQVEMPACTRFEWTWPLVIPFPFFSSPNLQVLIWKPLDSGFALNEAVLKSLHDFLLNCSCLQELDIKISHRPGLDSLIQFVFCDAWEQGVWHGIRSVGMSVRFHGSSENKKKKGSHFFNQMVGHQPDYEKWWKEFKVNMEDEHKVILGASI